MKKNWSFFLVLPTMAEIGNLFKGSTIILANFMQVIGSFLQHLNGLGNTYFWRKDYFSVAKKNWPNFLYLRVKQALWRTSGNSLPGLTRFFDNCRSSSMIISLGVEREASSPLRTKLALFFFPSLPSTADRSKNITRLFKVIWEAMSKL